MDQLAHLRVALEPAGGGARLRVQHDDLCPLTDRLVVTKACALGDQVATVHADPQAVRPAASAGDAVVQLPDRDTPGVVPGDPLAVHRVVPVARVGQARAGRVTKAAGAVDAVAHARPLEATPAIVRDAVGVAALDDLAQDIW